MRCNVIMNIFDIAIYLSLGIMGMIFVFIAMIILSFSYVKGESNRMIKEIEREIGLEIWRKRC